MRLPGVFCVVTGVRGIERHSGCVNRKAGTWKVHTMDPLPFHAAEFPQEPMLLGLWERGPHGFQLPASWREAPWIRPALGSSSSAPWAPFSLDT